MYTFSLILVGWAVVGRRKALRPTASPARIVQSFFSSSKSANDHNVSIQTNDQNHFLILSLPAPLHLPHTHTHAHAHMPTFVFVERIINTTHFVVTGSFGSLSIVSITKCPCLVDRLSAAAIVNFQLKERNSTEEDFNVHYSNSFTSPIYLFVIIVP